MLDRRSAITELLSGRGDAAVVSGLGSPTYDVASVEDNPRNYYLWGAMGSAVMVGLGLAISRPELDVIVITGDGELLMGLGSLATVGVKAPKNLAVVVLDNGHYGETGMQISHAGAGCDLSGVAKACGFARVHTISEPADYESARQMLHHRGAVRFLRVLIEPNDPPRVMPSRDGVEIKLRFQRAVGAPIS
jgi:thiamine pyrophosphate-dependent acetolactate synthase large subunit-like protein